LDLEEEGGYRPPERRRVVEEQEMEEQQMERDGLEWKYRELLRQIESQLSEFEPKHQELKSQREKEKRDLLQSGLKFHLGNQNLIVFSNDIPDA
jgi:hypothetical protein